VKDVLHAVDHQRTVRTLGDVDDALEPQQVRTAMLGQSFEEQR